MIKQSAVTPTCTTPHTHVHHIHMHNTTCTCTAPHTSHIHHIHHIYTTYTTCTPHTPHIHHTHHIHHRFDCWCDIGNPGSRSSSFSGCHTVPQAPSTASCEATCVHDGQQHCCACGTNNMRCIYLVHGGGVCASVSTLVCLFVYNKKTSVKVSRDGGEGWWLGSPPG